jgi:hypothetical protein
MSGLNLQPNQSSVQWVLGAATLKVKQLVHGFDHSPPSSPNIINRWSYTSTPYMSHGVYCDNFTFTLAYIYMPTHVHTHTHTHTHPTHIRTTPPHTRAHTHTHTHTQVHRLVCTCTHALTHTYKYLCTCVYTTTHYQSTGCTKRENCHARCFGPTFCHSTKLLNHVSQNTFNLN